MTKSQRIVCWKARARKKNCVAQIFVYSIILKKFLEGVFSERKRKTLAIEQFFMPR